MSRLFEEPGDSGGRLTGSPPGSSAPLAARMRPARLDEFVGQQELLAPGTALRRAIESGHPYSMILHGPPGSGKTTLARLIAAGSGAAFEEESAVAAGRAEVRAVIERARERARSGRATVFFLDEIHRFNKAQQDALLPAVEEGLVTLIGATTENPFFSVNSALLSRARVYELTALAPADVRVLLDRALARGECGDVSVSEEALAYAAEWTDGDARAALGGLELACSVAGSGGSVGLAEIADALQQRTIAYDRQADNHFDTISAWIKATRGSDPDASLYYLAVMLEAAIYLSLAPKSDAVKQAVHAARAYIREHGAAPPPPYLRSSTRSSGEYDNPHSHPDHKSDQPLLPESVQGTEFYRPDKGSAATSE